MKHLPPLPADIPANPNQTYKNSGWRGFGDWFGTGIIAPSLRKYRPFEEAKSFIHALSLKNQKESGLYCRGQLPGFDSKPEDIPANPHLTYKNKGWNSLGDWLGTNTKATHLREYLPFNCARNFVRKLSLKGRDDWKAYCNGHFEFSSLPDNIPKAPWIVYKDSGWISLSDWLGS